MSRKLSNSSSASLDFLRATSAQAVVIGHGISFCGVAVSLHQPNFPWMQNIAVVIFFILSGFLITYSLSQKNFEVYRFSHYVADRFSRIYVAFIPALLFVVALDSISVAMNREMYAYHAALNLKTFFGNILMLQDFPKLNIVTSFGSGRPFWTLAIEWWIYLFVGAIYFWMFTKKPTKYQFVILMFLSIVPLYNLLGGRGNGLTLYWIFGALVQYVWSNHWLSTVRLRYLIILFILTSISAAYVVLSTLVEYSPVFAFMLGLSLLLLIEITSRVELGRLFQASGYFLAAYSYTLYLIHYSIFDFLKISIGGGYGTFFIGFVASNLLACLIGRYVELSVTMKTKDLLYRHLNRKLKSSTPI